MSPSGRASGAAVLALAIVTACGGDPLPSSGGGHRAALVASAPPFESFERAPVDSIVAYAASLTYATDHGTTDEQRLAVRSPGAPPCPAGCAFGAMVTVQPQMDAVHLTLDDLKEGRVVGRLLNADTLAVDQFNLSAGGTTYLVVVAADSAPWIGYLISTDPARGSQSRIPRPISVDTPHAGRYLQSTARFLWTDAGESLWITCDGGCCTLVPS